MTARRGYEFFSLREVKKIMYGENWKHVYNSSRSMSKPMASVLEKKSEINNG